MPLKIERREGDKAVKIVEDDDTHAEIMVTTNGTHWAMTFIDAELLDILSNVAFFSLAEFNSRGVVKSKISHGVSL